MDDVFMPTRHRLTVHDAERMAEAGLFDGNPRVELIDGDLIDMAPIGQAHEAAVDGLTEAFVVASAGKAIVRIQGSVRLDASSAPQPDLAILRRRPDRYAIGARPGPLDILLLIEVADSSLHFDRTVKLPLYARAGVAEVWIVDLARRVLEAHRDPSGSAYSVCSTHHPGERVALSLAPGIAITVDFGPG